MNRYLMSKAVVDSNPRWAAHSRLFRECMQDEVRALGNGDFGQDDHFVTLRGIRGQKPIVFDDCGFELMTALCVSGVDLRPRWREEHAPMIPMQLADTYQGRLARRVLERRGGIDKSPVEEDPTTQSAR